MVFISAIFLHFDWVLFPPRFPFWYSMTCLLSKFFPSFQREELSWGAFVRCDVPFCQEKPFRALLSCIAIVSKKWWINVAKHTRQYLTFVCKKQKWPENFIVCISHCWRRYYYIMQYVLHGLLQKTEFIVLNYIVVFKSLLSGVFRKSVVTLRFRLERLGTRFLVKTQVYEDIESKILRTKLNSKSSKV